MCFVRFLDVLDLLAYQSMELLMSAIRSGLAEELWIPKDQENQEFKESITTNQEIQEANQELKKFDGQIQKPRLS